MKAEKLDKKEMSKCSNKVKVSDRKVVSTDRVSIKPLKHGTTGNGAGSNKESLRLGSWIRITAMQGQAGSSLVTLHSHPIISTNVTLSVTVVTLVVLNKSQPILFIHFNFSKSALGTFSSYLWH